MFYSEQYLRDNTLLAVNVVYMYFMDEASSVSPHGMVTLQDLAHFGFTIEVAFTSNLRLYGPYMTK